MKVDEAYNVWAESYDDVVNKTRDTEAAALRKTLQPLMFTNFLEIGCGTGKNTQWLVNHFTQVTSVDFSEEMLAKARQKVKATNVQFIKADITKPWNFVDDMFDGIGCSLVLEHIQYLQHIFSEASSKLKTRGFLYVGELHPFKQYLGSKARFETSAGVETVTCFTHHISEYLQTSKACGFSLQSIEEFFDEDENNNATIPRLIVFLFQKL